MKRPFIAFILALCLSIPPAYCDDKETETTPTIISNITNSIDIGVTLGTTGIGLDVSAKPTSFLRIRTGVDYMPRFTVPVRFNLDSYRDGALSETDFSELQDIMKKLTGFDVDQSVKMNCKANMVNFKLLFDFFPLRNKHWYATAGFYWGSSHIANAINAMEEMPTLLAIGMFNQMHDKILTTDFVEEPIYDNIYLDPDVADRLKEKMEETGRVGIHVGNFRDGKPYMMEPNNEGMVMADMIVNSFKPYLGLGYVTSINNHINIGVDGGVLFWGGTPRLITHEGVDLAKDVVDIPGKVGDYVSFAKALTVYPVLNFRIAYKFGK